jgi:hypothetical protein
MILRIFSKTWGIGLHPIIGFLGREHINAHNPAMLIGVFTGDSPEISGSILRSKNYGLVNGIFG